MTDARAAGTLFAIASALGYGASLPLSRLAFDEGTNALTVAFLRYVALAVLLGAWCAVRGRHSRTLRPRERLLSLLLGACFASVSLGTLLGSSVMAVSLTVLVFYTYPSLILITAALLERRMPRPIEAAVLAMALLGLALALDVDFAAINLSGLGFAGLAAVGALATFVIIERGLTEGDTMRITGLASFGAAVVSGGALAAAGPLALPGTVTGWLLLTGVIALFASAVLCMFGAIRLAGSVHASTLLFLEPVTAIVLAVALLAESLSTLQWAGAGLVVTAVALASLLGPPSHAEEVVT